MSALLSIQPSVLTDLATRGSVTLALVEIEGLRSINATFGREAGNDAIQALADSISSATRETDVAARIGEGLFAVFLGGASLLDATHVLQRVEDKLPDAGRHLNCMVEFSSGAAEWDGHEDLQHVFERADVWLVAEKRRRSLGSTVVTPTGKTS